jgi:hypothetical protein
MVIVDVGFTFNGVRVDELYDPEFHWQHPAFWIVCSRGHRFFATLRQVERKEVTCRECAEYQERLARWALEQRAAQAGIEVSDLPEREL